jgi:hypothetical protein
LCPLLASAQVRAIEVGDRLVLFHNRRQRLFDLNETAAAIWRQLGNGLACNDIAARLQAGGLPQSDADAFTAAAVTEWLREGFVVPLDVRHALEGQPSATQRLRIGPLTCELRYFEDGDANACSAVFTQFACDDANPARGICIVAHAGHDFLYSGDEPFGMCTPRQTVPALKAMLTADYCAAVADGFVTHGALLYTSGRSVFLAGAPGAGKSTLALALTSRGFAYGTDDIVHIDSRGLATGVPFAAAAKSTGWELLRPYLPHLDTLPSYERADAQVTRYVLPERQETGEPRPIDIAVRLDRRPGAKARLEPLSPLEMLCLVLDAGYTARRAIDPSTLERLAHNLSRAQSYRFVYDDLAGAVAAMEGLAGE